MALTSSRADVDMGMVLVNNTEEEVRSASLYVVGRAIDEAWSDDETTDVLQALGLMEADLDPERGKRKRGGK